MKKIPRVYCASIATETNTFSPLKTNMKTLRKHSLQNQIIIPKHQLYVLFSLLDLSRW